MARHKKGEETRNRIIDAAADLFHRDGIHAVSVDDVLAQSGTGKSQMYHYFKSKDDLVLAVADRIQNGVTASPMIAPIDDWQGLETWLRIHVVSMAGYEFGRGCPIGTLAYARREDQDALGAILAATYNIQRQPLVAFFDSRLSAQDKPAADADALATLCLATIQGAMILARNDRDGAAMEQAIDSLMRLLKATLGDP
jgi:AcrR family transcriptional regulator